MFLDACHYPLRQIQSGAACMAACTRLTARAHTIEKFFQLRLQRLDRRRIEFFKCEFRLRSWLFNRDAQSVAARVVERNVFVLLKEAHLADAFCRNSAG